MFFFSALICLHLNKMRVHKVTHRGSQAVFGGGMSEILITSQEETLQCGLSTAKLTRPLQLVKFDFLLFTSSHRPLCV